MVPLPGAVIDAVVAVRLRDAHTVWKRREHVAGDWDAFERADVSPIPEATKDIFARYRRVDSHVPVRALNATRSTVIVVAIRRAVVSKPWKVVGRRAVLTCRVEALRKREVWTAAHRPTFHHRWRPCNCVRAGDVTIDLRSSHETAFTENVRPPQMMPVQAQLIV
jgi:hypothetical protein